MIDFDTELSRIEDYRVVSIFINGIHLADWLGNVEQEKARELGIPSLAGNYEGLPPLMVLPPSLHFLGEPLPDYRLDNGKTVLMEYGNSGVPGENSIAAEIICEEEMIGWRNFEKFSHLLPDAGRSWDYSGLGPFIFSREQYMNSLLDAKNSAY